MLKGSFSLLGIKSPGSALKISGCNIQLFFKIFDRIITEVKVKKVKSKEKTTADGELEMV